MKNLALAICLVTASTSLAHAQQGYAGAFVYNVADHQVYAIAVKNVTTIKDISLGKLPKFSLDLDLFAGAGTKDGSAIAGFDISRTWHVAYNADVMLGAAFAVKQGDSFVSSFGPAVGFRLTF